MRDEKSPSSSKSSSAKTPISALIAEQWAALKNLGRPVELVDLMPLFSLEMSEMTRLYFQGNRAHRRRLKRQALKSPKT